MSALHLVTPSTDPGELAPLGELIEQLEAAQIRLYVTPGGALHYRAPQGAMTVRLRRELAAYKGALIRALRAAGAMGEAPAYPTARGACEDPAHGAPDALHYNYTLGRWLCRICEPGTYGLFSLAVTRAYHNRTAALYPVQIASEDTAPAPAPQLDASPAPAPQALTPRTAEAPCVEDLKSWPECFAALDTGGLYLARIGAHGAAGTPERYMLDGDTWPDPSSASARCLVSAMERYRITQLWVHPSWAAVVGLPMDTLEREKQHAGIPHPFAAGPWASDMGEDAPAGSWGAFLPGRVSSWLRFYRRGQSGSIALALPHFEARVPWRKAPDAASLLAAVLAYREAMGNFAYRSGPGPTSTALLRAVHRGSSAALDLTGSIAPAAFPAPARDPGLTPQLGWIRALTDAERERGRYVIGYDKNGMFPAACSSLPCGMGAPEQYSADDETAPALAHMVEALTDMQTRPRPRRPVGYWLAQVTLPAAAAVPFAGGLLPHPCYTGPKQADPAASWQWYQTATLVYAAELGARVEIREAHLWHETHEPFEPWYQRIRDARAKLMQAASASAPGAALALDAVKATYRQGIGWLDASWLRDKETPEDLYRPDWRHAVIATANANLGRNLVKAYNVSAGRAPFVVLTDAAYYISDTPDPLALADTLGLRMGDGLGQYKVKLAAFPLAELAPVWELQAAGRDAGRLVSAFAHLVNESEA